MSSSSSSKIPIHNNKEENQDHQNEMTITTLYKALSQGDTKAAASLIATDDLEYWFHGPPKCQYMMNALTGDPVGPTATFRFVPRSVSAVGGSTCVIAEGWEGAKAYWVHVWTLNKDGMVTQLREYFNTWLTVRDLRPSAGWDPAVSHSGSGRGGGGKVWQSMPRDLFRRSLPGLLLAI